MTQDSLLFILGAAVMSSLVGATVYLFHRFESAKGELIAKFGADLEVVNQRLKECEDDRNALRNQIIAIHTEMHELRKRLP